MFSTSAPEVNRSFVRFMTNKFRDNTFTSFYRISDDSFKQVMNALLYSRPELVANGEIFKLQSTVYAFSDSAEYFNKYKEMPKGDAASILFKTSLKNFKNHQNNNSILVAQFYGDTERRNIIKPLVDYVADKGNFIKQEDVTLYLKQLKDIDADVYQDKETNKTIIAYYTNVSKRSDDYVALHILVSLLPRLFPCIEKAKPLSEKEVALLKSLIEETDSYAYQRWFDDFVSENDLRTLVLREDLKGIGTSRYERQIKEADSLYADATRDYERARQMIETAFAVMEECSLKKTALEIKIKESGGDDEIIDYFIHNRNLTLKYYDRSRSELCFEVETYLNNFDADLFETMVSNTDSWLWQNAGSTTIKLLSRVVEGRWKMRFSSYITMSVSRDRFSVSGQPETTTAIPNPHLYWYSCLGSHEPMIHDAYRNNDILGAILTFQRAVGSLNFGDAYVGRKFISMIQGDDDMNFHNIPFIETEDGELLSACEALERIIHE